MKFLLCVFFVFFFFGKQSKAQIENRTSLVPSDTIYRQQGFTPLLNLDDDFDDLFFNGELNPFQSSALFPDGTSTIWLRTEFLLSHTFTSIDENEIEKHFTSPLYDKYLEDSKLNLFRYVLGLAQTGAVGYLAYRHLKKYGFR